MPPLNGGDFVMRSIKGGQQLLPPGECMSAREVAVEHGTSMLSHLGYTHRIFAKADQCLGQRWSIPRLDHQPAPVLSYQLRDLPIACGDRYERFADGSNAIKFAWHD